MLDMITNSSKIKYAIMDGLYTNSYLSGKSKVRVFINLESILNKMARANVVEYLKSNTGNNVIEFISSIINLAAHYKWYFIKKGYETEVIMYIQYPFNLKLRNRTFIPEYKKGYWHRFNVNPEYSIMTHMIEQGLPYTQTICEYIEGVHLLNSNTIEEAVIPYIVYKETNEGCRNIIVSNDIYDAQYRAYGFDILIPKGDKSILVGRDTIKADYQESETLEALNSLSPQMIIFLNAVVGNKYKSIPQLKGLGLKTAIKMINKAKDMKLITDNTNSPDILVSLIKEEYRDQFIHNYYCSSVDMQWEMADVSSKLDILSGIKDRFDNESLKTINDEVFTEFPLNIMELSSKPKKKEYVVF